MRVKAAVAAVAAVLSLAACAPDQAKPTGRPVVVASSWAVGELARAIGGREIDVVDLLPAGVEPHDAELSPRQVDLLEDADLILHLGSRLQPAVAEVAGRQADGQAVDLLGGRTGDPHVWLDPLLWSEVAHRVGAQLAAIGADGAPARATGYRAGLTRINDRFRTGLAECDRRVFVTPHDAFGHLARRYRLVEESVTGIDPEAEPDPRRVADLVDLARTAGVTTVFHEPGVPDGPTRPVAGELDATLAPLDPLEVGAPGTYESRMGADLAALTSALGCRTP
ncbi:MAG TPA: metal ABC transporter substrate-binding protein [Acidimicrobiales bacterium]|nr:metal ABC transporter substrate-binding protein [Acidimicrobiales bacterium]